MNTQQLASLLAACGLATSPVGPLSAGHAPLGAVPMPRTPTPLNQTLIGGASILYGTCEVAQTYGTVESGSVKLTGDKQEWEDCSGNTALVLIRNERYELEFEALWDSGGGVPDIGTAIAFPEVGVTGNIIDATLMFAKLDRVKIKITATQWKSLGSSPTVTQLTTGS